MYRHTHGSMVLAAASLCALFAAPVAGQNVFNGVITYKLDFEQAPGEEVISSSGSKFRVDAKMAVAGTPQEFIMLYDMASGDVTTVMPAQKRYMTTNYKKMEEAMDKKSADELAPKIVNTGKKETIAGHSCEVWAETDKKMEVCVATDLGHFMPFERGYAMMRARAAAGGASPPVAALIEHFKNGFVPLRMTFSDSKGRPNSVVATSIERKSVPADMFVVPAGYTGMRMP